MEDQSRLEFRHSALKKLSPGQWVVYEAICDIGEGLTTIKAIAQWVDMKTDTVAAALKILQKHQFIEYTVIGGCQGVLIEWVRQSQNDALPHPDTLRYRRMQYGHKLRSPKGKLYTIPPGGLAKFARDNTLSYRCLQYLIDGKISHHKQWTLAKKSA